MRHYTHFIEQKNKFNEVLYCKININISVVFVYTKKKQTEIANNSNEKWTISTNYIEIKNFIRGYYEKLHAEKVDNLDETRQILRNIQPTKTKS